MTNTSLTIPVECEDDTIVSQGLTARSAAVQAWKGLPERVHKTCKQIRVVYRGATLISGNCWTLHYIFQLKEGFPEFAVMYDTGNMGMPIDWYVLKEFTTEELAEILINGQPHMVKRERKPGLLEAFQTEVNVQLSRLDSKRRTTAEFASCKYGGDASDYLTVSED